MTVPVLETIIRTRLHGEPLADLAAEQSMSPQLLCHRRWRAEVRLRDLPARRMITPTRTLGERFVPVRVYEARLTGQSFPVSRRHAGDRSRPPDRHEADHPPGRMRGSLAIDRLRRSVIRRRVSYRAGERIFSPGETPPWPMQRAPTTDGLGSCRPSWRRASFSAGVAVARRIRRGLRRQRSRVRRRRRPPPLGRVDHDRGALDDYRAPSSHDDDHPDFGECRSEC